MVINMYLEVVLKTIFLYFIIVFAYRIMGKKEVGQLSIIDLIVSISHSIFLSALRHFLN